jgi:hypothetical protein
MLLLHEHILRSKPHPDNLCEQVTDSFCRGDLHVALDLYRKAESYVPDNIKLKERWILFIVQIFLHKIAAASAQGGSMKL